MRGSGFHRPEPASEELEAQLDVPSLASEATKETTIPGTSTPMRLVILALVAMAVLAGAWLVWANWDGGSTPALIILPAHPEAAAEFTLDPEIVAQEAPQVARWFDQAAKGDSVALTDVDDINRIEAYLTAKGIALPPDTPYIAYGDAVLAFLYEVS